MSKAEVFLCNIQCSKTPTGKLWSEIHNYTLDLSPSMVDMATDPLEYLSLSNRKVY